MIKYTKEKLEEAIKKSKSWADVCRIFNVSTSGGIQAHIKSRANFFEVDYSHFLGRGWSRETTTNIRKTADEILFKRDSGNRQRSSQLKRALIESNIEYKCVKCDIKGEWMGEEINLEIDHIDGNPMNDIKENLRFICPNCHSQTKNYKNKKRYIVL